MRLELAEHKLLPKVVRPLGNWVVVTPENRNDSVGDIILPETNSLPCRLGRVKAVGPGPRLESGERFPIDLAEDDLVLYRGYLVKSEAKLDGDRCLWIASDDIAVRFRDEPEPLGDSVLVTIPEWTAGRQGDIEIPETFKSAYYEAEVLKVGPGRRNLRGGWDALNVRVSDSVTFHRYSGMPFSYKKWEFFVIRPDDILTVVEKSKLVLVEE